MHSGTAVDFGTAVGGRAPAFNKTGAPIWRHRQTPEVRVRLPHHCRAATGGADAIGSASVIRRVGCRSPRRRVKAQRHTHSERFLGEGSADTCDVHLLQLMVLQKSAK